MAGCGAAADIVGVASSSLLALLLPEELPAAIAAAVGSEVSSL